MLLRYIKVHVSNFLAYICIHDVKVDWNIALFSMYVWGMKVSNGS